MESKEENSSNNSTNNSFSRKREPLTKVGLAALSHYARKDVQNAMFEFCKNRETIANFNNKFFAKRPDCFDYPSDISNASRQGATSFHCSEELWQNPLDINTDMTPEQYNEIKVGWDFLIDIDSKYLDYSKIAAEEIIKVLNGHGVKNIGIKFSGSKGFHLIVPFKSFPSEMNGELTKDNFPMWPRLIAGYIFSQIRNPMNQRILQLTGRETLEEKGELKSEYQCPRCKNPAIRKVVGTYHCQDIRCKSVVEHMKSNRKEISCPSCNGKMLRVSERRIIYCNSCKQNTASLEIKQEADELTKKEEFKIEDTIKSTEDAVDLVLVSSRHLFRAPYSLHEKTAFASIVVTKDEIRNFKPIDADPLKIKEVRNFMPEVIEGEARELLAEALEWGKDMVPKEKPKKYTGQSIDLKGLEIAEDMFPPVIKKILKGIPADGRKRALSLLLSFWVSLEFPQDYIEEKIKGWNKKNYHPLKEGYIKSQITWYQKNPRLPPNYDKPVYKEFGIKEPPEPGMKNPINYTIKKAMQAKGNKSREKMTN